MPDLAPAFDAIPVTVWRDAPPEADAIPEPEHRLPSGWWLLPSVICGAAVWVTVAWAIFA